MGDKVSIIIPTNSGTHFLKKAIDSALAQTYKNIEVVVVVYGTAHDSEVDKIVESYAGQVKYYPNTSESLTSALNYGIKKATGQYFCWMTNGYTYNPDKIKKQVECINDSDDTVVMSSWDVLNGNRRRVQSNTIDERLEKSTACFLAFTDKNLHLNTCSAMFPKKAFEKSGLFGADLRPSEDLIALTRLLNMGVELRVVNDSLMSFTPHFELELLDVAILTHLTSDFVNSEIIRSLAYDEIVGYFGGTEEIIAGYKELLGRDAPRSASFLMEKTILGLIHSNDLNRASELVLNDLSMLSADEMTADASSLISKISNPSAKKKIMFSSAHWLTGGMERVMSTLFRELTKEYEIFLITPFDERKSYIYIPDDVVHIKISHGIFASSFDSVILTYAKLLKIDAVIGYINLFDKQLNLYNICAGTDIKTIASNHEYYFYPYKNSAHHKVVEKRLNALKRCDAVIWPNNFNAALCGMYVDRSYVIGNPNNFDVSVQNSLQGKKNIVLCVGRFNDPVKRVDRMLECFSLILKNTPDAKLVLVGKFENDTPISPDNRVTVNQLISDLSIPHSSLEFVGETDRVQDYYAQAKVLMLTSNSEGFGMVLNEAACHGVPSVGNYIPGIEDIIKDGENGFITEQDDLREMASRVSEILSNDALHKKLSKNASTYVEQFDSRHIVDKWHHLIDTLLTESDSKRSDVKIDNVLGYKISNQKLFSEVLAKELNEIFYLKLSNTSVPLTGFSLIISKATGLPKRLRANIQHEGLLKTVQKTTARSYRIVRLRLKF